MKQIIKHKGLIINSKEYRENGHLLTILTHRCAACEVVGKRGQWCSCFVGHGGGCIQTRCLHNRDVVCGHWYERLVVEVHEACIFATERQSHIADGTVTMLGNDYFGLFTPVEIAILIYTLP